METASAEDVRRRAGGRCEYCRIPDGIGKFRHVADHILARQHGGVDLLENLALCCGRCNQSKGPNIAGFDHETGTLVPLFNPRKDIWREHFQWDGPVLVGTTAVGRATHVLAVNLPIRIAARRLLMQEGAFDRL